jgi:glycosyltransferase involved in cell wall biosynthesis
MHICFITNEYPKEGFSNGGIGSFVKTIATALIQNEIQVSVVGMNYAAKDEQKSVYGVTVYRLKKSAIKGLAWYFNSKVLNKKIREIHRQNPINIIEASELGFAFINKIKGIKYIIRLHGGHHFFAEAENRKINKWKGFQEKRSFKKADAFIAVSNFVKTHTEKYLTYNHKPMVYINNPINTQLFKPIEGIVSEDKIVFAGTVCEKKGIRQLIQAFPIVKKYFSEVSLEIYGRDWIFPDGSSYIQMLNEKELPKLGKLADAIHFHGSIEFSEIPSKYAQAVVCVFPSHMETLGLVAPEAMAMEKPVVFTYKGPGPEIIEDGRTGLLCDPHSPEDIAQKIIWMLEHKTAAKQMGIEARVSVLERFELKNIFEKNRGFYEQIIRS